MITYDKTSPLKAEDLSDLMELVHTYQIDGGICDDAFKISLQGSNKTPLQVGFV